MDKPLTLASLSGPRVLLRAAAGRDLDDLRAWKNANKAGFFFKGEITPQMQDDWFKGYLARPDDFMFIVEHEGRKVGCMGFRAMPGGGIDAYNMIAAPDCAGRGLMKAAMLVMCSYAADTRGRDIGCLVVTGNPAVRYYEACGYTVVGDDEGHHILKLDWARFAPVRYEVLEGV